MGKSSPTSGRGRHAACRASDGCPSPSRPGVDVAIDGQDVTVKGPKGTLTHTRRRARSTIAQDDDGTLAVTRPDDERRSRCAARPVPHAGGQHGHRRHRGLHQDARDRRHRLPRPAPRARPRVRARLQPPGRWSTAPGGHHLRGRGADPVLRRRASTSSRSARSPPTSASCASPTRTRARACVTPGEVSPPQGRKGW